MKDKIVEVLRTCYDPEIPVNIVDLGLVYDCIISEEDGETNVEVKMTLTAPGCGMGEVLMQEIEMKLRKHPDIDQAKIKLVFDPPWDRSMLSTAAQLELGLL